MTQSPDLVDRPALERMRERIAQAPVDFLHRLAAREVSERLHEVNRRFTAPAIIGPMAPVWLEELTGAGAVDDALLLADSDILDLRDSNHDLVIHALCLHWSNDPVGQLVQMRHALRPDGLALAVMFGGQSLHELRASLAEAEVDATGGLSPRVLPMGEVRDLGGLLQRAGFALPVADTLRQMVTYPDAPALMRDLRGMGEANALTTRQRKPLRRDILARATALYTTNFPATDHPARIRATAELIFLTGWKPGPNQQQPLRPGSARSRLADALSVTETPLKDE